jgi:hypothetical protein
MKIRPVGTELVHADREREKHDEDNSRLSQWRMRLKTIHPQHSVFTFCISVSLRGYSSPSIKDEGSHFNCYRHYTISENKSSPQKYTLFPLSEVINQNEVNPFILALEFVFCFVGSLIQGDSGRKDNIFGGNSIGHCKKKISL